MEKLPDFKASNVHQFGIVLAHWESELTRFVIRDPEYKIGTHRKRAIIYESMPIEIQTLIDIQTSSDQLETYDKFIEFLMKVTTSSRFAPTKAFSQISLNVMGEQAKPTIPSPSAQAAAVPTEYTSEQWQNWINLATEE